MLGIVKKGVIEDGIVVSLKSKTMSCAIADTIIFKSDVTLSEENTILGCVCNDVMTDNIVIPDDGESCRNGYSSIMEYNVLINCTIFYVYDYSTKSITCYSVITNSPS